MYELLRSIEVNIKYCQEVKFIPKHRAMRKPSWQKINTVSQRQTILAGNHIDPCNVSVVKEKTRKSEK